MKKITILIVSCCLLLFSVLPTIAATPTLNERLSSLEASWSKFRIGGNLSLEATAFRTNGEFTQPGFEQDLLLFMDTRLHEHYSYSLKLSHQGGWGSNYQNLGSSNYPMSSPFQLEESVLRVEFPNSLNYLGKFSFSPTPLGLISDFRQNKIEGLVLQKTWKKYHAIGVYSRVSSNYTANTNQIDNAEDYLSVRFGGMNGNNIWGINLVPNGVTGEKAISLDASFSAKKSTVSAEIACYSFDTTLYPDYVVDSAGAIMVSYAVALSPETFMQIKGARIEPKFTPSHSSLAHSSGDDCEWFLPNSQGIEVSLKNNLKNNFSLENRLMYAKPIENYSQIDRLYHWRSTLSKRFSAQSAAYCYFDLKKIYSSTERQYGVLWNLSF